jgi:hypothetical protein
LERRFFRPMHYLQTREHAKVQLIADEEPGHSLEGQSNEKFAFDGQTRVPQRIGERVRCRCGLVRGWHYPVIGQRVATINSLGGAFCWPRCRLASR